MNAPSTPEIITADAELTDLIRDLRHEGRFAFDTEFVGEDSYKPEVCLIQIATEDRHVLVDPLAGLDARPLWHLVADPIVQVVVHAGSEDLALCQLHAGKPAANVIDLQIAAGLVGLGYPASLARLTRLATGATLHKSQTLTDWRCRPLAPEQIDYAVEDVAYLLGIHRFLQSKVAALGRSEWLAHECDDLCQAAARQTTNPVQVRRLRGAGSLSGRERAIAEALLVERDSLAKELDRPPRTIVRDHLLVEMARRGWTDPNRIRALRGLNLSMSNIRRLAKAVETAKSKPTDHEPLIAIEGDTPEEETLVAFLTAALRDYCNRNEISYSLLAGKNDIRQVVHGHTRELETSPRSTILNGWRGQAVGSLLERVLSGKSAMRVARNDGIFRLILEE